jgi:hypothetical protein
VTTPPPALPGAGRTARRRWAPEGAGSACGRAPAPSWSLLGRCPGIGRLGVHGERPPVEGVVVRHRIDLCTLALALVLARSSARSYIVVPPQIPGSWFSIAHAAQALSAGHWAHSEPFPT